MQLQCPTGSQLGFFALAVEQFFRREIVLHEMRIVVCADKCRVIHHETAEGQGSGDAFHFVVGNGLLRGAPEDDNNVALLTESAKEAVFETKFCYVDEVTFSEVEGIYAPDGKGAFTRYDFWFKLVPWEYIAEEEPALCSILTKIVERNLAVLLNPAYTMIFQSKGILKYLWDLFQEEPLLLESTFKEPIGRSAFPFVQKVFFGREGANVTVYDDIGLPIEVREGDYGKQASVYQAYADLARDEQGQYYQAGIFFAYEACGLGFRRSPQRIIDNGAQFVGHVVE